jgi:hypothetical protein
VTKIYIVVSETYYNGGGDDTFEIMSAQSSEQCAELLVFGLEERAKKENSEGEVFTVYYFIEKEVK